MNKFNCPHCASPTVSVMRKLCLGPAVPATCKACGGKVGVSYKAMFALAPVFAAIGLSAFIQPFALKLLLWIAGFLIMAVIHLIWVPLERR
jgi:hypothetical protein